LPFCYSQYAYRYVAAVTPARSCCYLALRHAAGESGGACVSAGAAEKAECRMAGAAFCRGAGESSDTRQPARSCRFAFALLRCHKEMMSSPCRLYVTFALGATRAPGTVCASPAMSGGAGSRSAAARAIAAHRRRAEALLACISDVRLKVVAATDR